MSSASITGRIVGIRHRIKQTAEQKAQPTECFAFVPGKKKPVKFVLKTDMDEYDWAFGQLADKWRPVKDDEDLSEVPERHVKWERLKKKEADKIDCPIFRSCSLANNSLAPG